MPKLADIEPSDRAELIAQRLAELPNEERAMIEYLAESLVNAMHERRRSCNLGKVGALELLFCIGRAMNNKTKAKW
jgi:hypothetical protein